MMRCQERRCQNGMALSPVWSGFFVDCCREETQPQGMGNSGKLLKKELRKEIGWRKQEATSEEEVENTKRPVSILQEMEQPVRQTHPSPWAERQTRLLDTGDYRCHRHQKKGHERILFSEWAAVLERWEITPFSWNTCVSFSLIQKMFGGGGRGGGAD